MTKVVFNFNPKGKDNVYYVVSKLLVPPAKGSSICLSADIIYDTLIVDRVVYNMKYDFWDINLEIEFVEQISKLRTLSSVSGQGENDTLELEKTLLALGWTEDFDALLKALS